MSQHSPTDPTDKEPDEPTQGEPVVLVGEPKSLRGELHWDNTGDEKVVLRDALVRAAPAVGAEAAGSAAGKLLAADAPRAAHLPVALSATIPPRRSQSVPLAFDLGRHTPPGEYHGELEVGGRTRPLVMHVEESVRLRVSPAQIVIDGGAGERITKRVVLTNEGNVALTIGGLGSVALGEELMLSFGLRASVAAADHKTRGLEELFAEIVRDDARALTRQVGSLEVSNPEAPVVLRPGEVRPLDLEIRLPENLEPNSRYRGRLPLYTADLEFVVVPVSGGAGRATEPPEPDSTKY